MTHMKRLTMLILLLAAMAVNVQGRKISYSVEKIWGDGQHCAFTSLIEFKGRYYCAFREGESHIFDKNGNAEGKIRVLVSGNGRKWKSAALTGKDGIDLRDPKLSVTPDGRLMVSLGGSIYREGKFKSAHSHVTFSNDGKTFSVPEPVNINRDSDSNRNWVWRVTWQGNTGYAVNYEGKNEIFLLSTEDGINYDVIRNFEFTEFPNESTIRFLNDGRMSMIVRRERGERHAFWGVSQAPFTVWEWTELPMYIGGPDHIVLKDGKIIAGGRSLFSPKSPKTVIFSVDPEKGTFHERLVLPSGGDTSYPGFLVVGKELWISYYSTHETPNASIYLAKIPLSYFE